jgi:DNA repair protein RecO (recombination protein O)
VTLLTEDHGKLTGIAKGAKNSKRRFAGTLEPFLQIRAVFQIRPSSDLVFLHRCELLRPFRRFTRDLECWAAGSYVIDLTDRMVLGRESDHHVYDLVLSALALLDAGTEPGAVLQALELRLLAASGYEPGLAACQSCGRDFMGLATVYLVAHRGGFLCRPCVPAGEVVRPVSGATARELDRLSAEPLERAIQLAAPSDEAKAVVEVLLTNATNGPVRSRAFLGLSRVDSPGLLR